MEIITTSFKVHNPKEGDRIFSSIITALYFILHDNLVALILYKEMNFSALKVGWLTLNLVHINHCLHPGVGFSSQVNTMSIDWRTPLFNACVNGSQECVNLLLDHGATPQPESDLASPIHEAAKRGKSMGNFRIFNPVLQESSYY